MTTIHSLVCSAAVMAGLAVAGAAGAEDAKPGMVKKTDAGSILVDAKGMTLYTFDKDSDGRSACSGECAAAWPPLAASAKAKADGNWSVVKRDDGSQQWAYKGKPLYTWIKDKKPNDVTGDGVNKVWHTATP